VAIERTNAKTNNFFIILSPSFYNRSLYEKSTCPLQAGLYYIRIKGENKEKELFFVKMEIPSKNLLTAKPAF
jgi:hypothetical protein